jgi:hypothetical protein
MSKVYVLLKKAYVKSVGFPTFDILTDPPQELAFGEKLAALEPGECVDVFKAAGEVGRMQVQIFRVSNINGQPKEELLEQLLMER